SNRVKPTVTSVVVCCVLLMAAIHSIWWSAHIYYQVLMRTHFSDPGRPKWYQFPLALSNGRAMASWVCRDIISGSAHVSGLSEQLRPGKELRSSSGT
ncbi:hypothetical protein, partial [Paractinoplanes toevensis]|uniref:hypothetical protein n=1 Tax=Paractinoplanes toevensis TaxID=571911 RepID=UPI001BB352EE